MTLFNQSRRGQLSQLGRLSLILSLLVLSDASTPLIDSTGSTINRIPTDRSLSSGVIGIITSPGTPSPSGLNEESSTFNDDDPNLSLRDSDNECILSCRGATLNAASSGERLSLGTTSLVSGAIILDGISQGDVEQGLRHSRHARTLTALFRAKIRFPSERQLLLLGMVEDVVDKESLEKYIATEVRAIFDAVAVESMEKVSFIDMYDLQIVALQTPEDAESVRSWRSSMQTTPDNRTCLAHTLCLDNYRYSLSPRRPLRLKLHNPIKKSLSHQSYLTHKQKSRNLASLPKP